MINYITLLMCTVLLQRHAPARWQAIQQYSPVNKDPAEAQRLLARVGRAADDTLMELGQTPGMTAVVAQLRPQSFDDVQEVVRQTDGLHPTVLPLLLEWYEDEISTQTVHTPASVTRLLTRVILQDLRGDSAPKTIADPFVRSGEMLAAASQVINDRTTVFRGAGSDGSSLVLAGMSLTLMDVHADLRSGLHSWPGKADVVLTNPPFNSKNARFRTREDDEWILGPPPKGNDNFAWVQVCLEALKSGGVAGMVLPNSAAQSASAIESSLRHALVERGDLMCVIALPSRLFANTPIPVCVWVFRSGAKAEGVLFIDASRTGQRNARGKSTLTDDDVRSIADVYQAWHTNRDLSNDHALSSVWIAKDDIHANGDVLYPGRYVKNNVAKPESLPTSRTRMDEQWSKTRTADEQVHAVLRAYDEASPSQGVEWTRLALSDVCDVQAGPSPRSFSAALSKSKNRVVRVIVPKHLRNHVLVTPDGLMSEEEARPFARFTVRDGDVLTVRTGTIGATALVRSDQTGWLMNPALIRLRPKETSLRVLDPGYLVAYLRLLAVQDLLHEVGVATAVPTMSSKSLRQLPISLPPLDEQRRISSILTAFDEQIAAHRAFVDAATTTRTALAEALLAGADDIR